jgi:aminoglycoside phosphotransferase
MNKGTIFLKRLGQSDATVADIFSALNLFLSSLQHNFAATIYSDWTR